MRSWLSDPRRRSLAYLAAASFICLALATISLNRGDGAAARREIGELVESGLAERIPELGLIMVTTKDETYHLVRNPDGWVMTEKGDYPVDEERIQRLADATATMRYDEAMTRDERKFDMIGLGDPLRGGTGALLELGDGRGDVFAKQVIGYRSGRSYVRSPEDLQAWAVAVENMPPLQRGTAWLDLDPVGIDPGEILEVTVQPLVGAAYSLRPGGGDGGTFEIAPPNHDLRVLAPFSLTLVATAIATFDPIDVAPAAVSEGASFGGVHTTRLRDGVIVEATAWRTGGRGWVTISARAATDTTGPATQRALQITEAANGWAYALTEADWEGFTAPLAILAVEE